MLTETQLKLLDEIAPWWAKRIRKGNLKPTRTYTLADPDKCMEGEAHQSKKKPLYERYWFSGADAKAYCSFCNRNGFQLVRYGKDGSRNTKFDTYVKRFLTHFVKVHRPKPTSQ